MRKTDFKQCDNPILVDTNGLRAITQTGFPNAVKIGTNAGARVQIVRSVRWNVEKVKRYLDTISIIDEE